MSTIERRRHARQRVLCLVATVALAGHGVHAHAASADEARLLRTLQKTHPGTEFTSVERSPVDGLYEVWMNDNVAYVSARNPRFFVFGRIFDTQTMRDITEPRLAQTAHATKSTVTKRDTATRPIAFEALPFTDAIVTVRGNGARRVAVFSDPACPFCRQLEQELDGIDNLTTYTFLVPFQGDAKPIAVWCSPDRVQAWQRLMRHGDSTLLVSGSCSHPIQRNHALAQQLGVQGTPTLFWQDGSRTEGYVDRQVVMQRLSETTAGTQP